MKQTTLDEHTYEYHDKKASAVMGTIFIMMITWGILLGAWGIKILMKDLMLILSV